MPISSIGSVGNFDPSQMASKMAKKMVLDFDTSKEGSIDKAEFIAGMKSKGVSQTNAENIFGAIDTKGTGKITQADIETAMKKIGGKNGPPPPGGKGAPTGGAQGSPPSDNSKVYDKADSNKDGTVSSQEELEYYLAHPGEKAISETATDRYNKKGDIGEEIDGTLDISA
jgi:Ca2+-binding EF-hand superfamily protein